MRSAEVLVQFRTEFSNLATLLTGICGAFAESLDLSV
jgi:hypothetical protein